jgi:hypothetical protein
MRVSLQTVEFRVKWTREGACRATTRIYQSEAPARRMALVLEGRLAEAFPSTDPAAAACCNGYQCTCEGETNAEVWAKRHDEFPPIVDGPFIERRTVGAWT